MYYFCPFFTCWRVCWCCFCVWLFRTNRNLIQMWSNHFNIFALALKFRILVPNFKISFIVFLSIFCHCISNRYSLSYIMLICTLMSDIRRRSNYDSGDPYPSVFIQCINGRDPMSHKLWCHGLAGLCREVHLTVQVEIATWTVREFITDYWTANIRCNRMIGEVFINGRVQLLFLPEVWGSSFPYIYNADIT